MSNNTKLVEKVRKKNKEKYTIPYVVHDKKSELAGKISCITYLVAETTALCWILPNNDSEHWNESSGMAVFILPAGEKAHSLARPNFPRRYFTCDVTDERKV